MIEIKRVSKDLIEHEGERRNHEGRHVAYEDSQGIVTLGYGRNIQERGISEAEARVLLHNDILNAAYECQENLPWFNSLDAVRQEVLVNMVFNLGWPRFSGFKKMLAALEKGWYSEAAVQMLDSRWADQVGRRAAVLAQRMDRGER